MVGLLLFTGCGCRTRLHTGSFTRSNFDSRGHQRTWGQGYAGLSTESAARWTTWGRGVTQSQVQAEALLACPSRSFALGISTCTRTHCAAQGLAGKGAKLARDAI